MHGHVNEFGLPIIDLSIGDHLWPAVIDSGFNGDVELPDKLSDQFKKVSLGTISSTLAGGQTTIEECYYLKFPFDGQYHPVQATFVNTNRILIGTRLLRNHRLTIDFPDRTVQIERVATP